MTTHQDMIMQFGGMPVGEIVQGNTYFVDNSKSSSNDNNTGRNWKRPKSTIQSAIDEAVADKANGGHRIYVMGSGRKVEWSETGFHALTGADLYGVYREQIEIPYNACGMQLFGLNRPLITGQDGINQNLDGLIPTVQIGSYNVSSKGPLYTRIKGFHIGGFGYPAGTPGDHQRYGVGIAIGQHEDTSYIDDCYSHIIEDCYFRATNCAAAGQTNDTDVDVWIKTWGNEKIEIKRSFFFKGNYAIGLLGSENNQSMSCQLSDLDFQYQATYCVYGSGTNLWCQIKGSTFNPQASNTELNLVGSLGSKIVDCAFPLCAAAATTTTGIVDTSENIGTHTGWQILGCHAQKGHLIVSG